MRAAVLLLLVATVLFAPAVQAQACFCGSAPADEHGQATCCCDDAAVCCCPGCDAHDSKGQDGGSDSVTNCVCSSSQPLAGQETADTFVADDEAIHYAIPLTANPQTAPLTPRPSIHTVDYGFRLVSPLPTK